jgi:hypothetical protein
MNSLVNDVLALILERITIPHSCYEKAAERHRSLGKWLHRPESLVAAFDPDVQPQGSFLYGVVNRPLDDSSEYDLDNITVHRALTKGCVTQEALKDLYGNEIKAYARAHSMLTPVEEHNRCRRLRYADEVQFHLDTLPCAPEDLDFIGHLLSAGVPPRLAERAVAITDRRHPHYRAITALWPNSNPGGFGLWFQGQAALGLESPTAPRSLRAAIEDVPPYEWKTTLQGDIQILKRHSEVMFRRAADLAPISMIIANLAAHAYEGEIDLFSALTNIARRMHMFVRQSRPRIPNPANPLEDYADKWSKDPRVEQNFWRWLAAARADIERLPALINGNDLRRQVDKIFGVDLTPEELHHFDAWPVISLPAAPVLLIAAAPKPWG